MDIENMVKRYRRGQLLAKRRFVASQEFAVERYRIGITLARKKNPDLYKTKGEIKCIK